MSPKERGGDDSRSGAPQDLGFRHRLLKNGDVEISRAGRVVTRLRARAAAEFVAELEAAPEYNAQQLMARVTGNYKRGNERVARQHPRNRS